MGLVKYVTTGFTVAGVLDSPIKVANYVPDVYVPDELQRAVASLRPDPRFAYVHLIAMGDGDAYGSNLNGDIFTADQLTGTQAPHEAAKNPAPMTGIQLPRFKTFEQAKFYRHHANGAHDPHYGDVACACWNDVMRRVELLVRIAKQAIPELGMSSGADIVVKLDSRGFISVSMGTKIDYERCRICGHENEFVSQRCSHLANQMNEILPDGRQVSAENFGCRFFDISDVTIPAEPIALSVQKVAGAADQATPNQALNDGPAPWARWQKQSEIEKHIGADSVVGDIVPDESQETSDFLEPFTADEIKAAAAAGGDLATVLSTAAVAGVVFSPVELAQLTGFYEPDKLSSVTHDYEGFGVLRLDKFSTAVYNALQPKLASRSGYQAPCLRTGWEPAKLAADGFTAVAAYYQAYRDALRSFPTSTYHKAAHRLVPSLLRGSSADRAAQVNGALYHLAHAGMLA